METFHISFEDEDRIKHENNKTIEMAWFDTTMDLFFRQHPNLKSVSLVLEAYPFDIKMVGQLINLEHLTVDIADSRHNYKLSVNLQSICELTKLKSIWINTADDNVTIDAAFIDGLSHFHKLRILRLTPWSWWVKDHGSNVPGMIWQQLHQLTELTNAF